MLTLNTATAPLLTAQAARHMTYPANMQIVDSSSNLENADPDYSNAIPCDSMYRRT